MWVKDLLPGRLLVIQKEAKRVKSQMDIGPNSISPKELIFMKPLIYLNASLVMGCVYFFYLL